MAQDPRETQLELDRKNHAAIFDENGGPEKIRFAEFNTVKQSDLEPGEALVRVRTDPEV